MGDNGTTAEQCLAAFRRFVGMHPRVGLHDRVPQVYHACGTGKCHWFEYQNIYICRHTGNIHFCGDMCDRLVETHEHNVCSLTGRAYPLELCHENAIAWKRDSLNRVHNVDAPPRTRVAKTVNTTNYTRGSDWANTMHRLSLDAHNFVTRLLQAVDLPEGRKLAELVDTTYVTQYILSLWIQIINTELYRQKHSHKYKFVYHCAVVVYNMIDGVEIPVGNTVIPVHDAIRRYIPPVKKLPPQLKIEQSAFTANGKIFQQFLSHIYQPSPCLGSSGVAPTSRSRS